MEYVMVPLNIAQRASRVYRPILPYVRKHIAERRNTVEAVETVEKPKLKKIKGKK